MAQLARSKFLALRFAEEVTFHVEAFLQGTLELFSNTHLTVYSCLAGQDVRLDADEIRWLATLPESQWMPLDEARPDGFPDDERFHELLRLGVVILDPKNAEGEEDGAENESFVMPDGAQAMLELHREVASIPWHPTTLHTHMVNQDHEHGNAGKAEPLDLVTKNQDAEASADKFLDKWGDPPPAFYEAPDAGPPIPLSLGHREGNLYDALHTRRTRRAFDDSRPMDPDHLATLLRYTFGCLGRHPLSPRFFSLHKGSPSGGSLHPIEAYPVLRNVDGFETGFYHYDTRRHALRLLAPMAEDELRERMTRLAMGQVFAAEAHVAVFLVARYQRNFWKYRERINTFNVILKDAGHLSQTFQLVATDLGLSAFYTGAIDPPEILKSLGYERFEDRFHHGPIGILGTGHPPTDDQTLMPYEPYDPMDAR